MNIKKAIDTKKIKLKNIATNSNNKSSITLTIIDGEESEFGKIFTFYKEHILIGRNRYSDIFIDDEKTSKDHCEIKIIKDDENKIDRIIIKDLYSTNGTYVNEKPISNKTLKSGDKIKIGETTLRFSYNDELEEKYHSKLFNIATSDSLTKLYNKRYIISELENQYKIAKRNNRIFSLIMFDIDNFKKVNDKYGHIAGDEFLKNVSSYITTNLREQDIAGRFGGEEFLIILPETKIEGATILADKIREKIEKSEMVYRGHTVKATISAGISQFNISYHNIEELLEITDKALYKAKNLGKNKVIKAN
jgi:diguanylate cyclase (GGDEF)-like protein